MGWYTECLGNLTLRLTNKFSIVECIEPFVVEDHFKGIKYNLTSVCDMTNTGGFGLWNKSRKLYAVSKV